MIRPSYAALLAALALPGLAWPSLAHAQGASTDPSKVDAGTYALEPQHTQVGFDVLHFGFTPYYGRFAGASGNLTLDPRTPASSKLDVKIPVASVSTTSDKLNDELRSADWLDATKYPDITFVSTKVVPAGRDAAKVTGDLTIHGVTKPVTLSVKFVGAGVNPIDKNYTVGFSATGEISRSAFGVTKYVPLIGDRVTITLSGAFEKQS